MTRADERAKRIAFKVVMAAAMIPFPVSGQAGQPSMAAPQVGPDALPPEGVRTIQDAIKALNARANDKSAPARPLGNPASFFGPDAYPATAIRAQEQGRTVVRIEINARGFPTGCSVLTSSGSTALDETTCRIAQTRMQYAAARDARGRAVASQYTLPVRWVLPTDATPPPVVDLTTGRVQVTDTAVQLQIDEDGHATACKVLRKSEDGGDPCADFKAGSGGFPAAFVDGRPSKSVLTMETKVTAERPDAPAPAK